MTLQERLSQEMKSAMLTKDADRLSTLRLLKSVIGYLLVERKTETLSDAEIWSVVAFLDALPGMPPSKYLDMRSKLAQGPETPTQEAAR